MYWRLVIKINVVDQLAQMVVTGGSGIDVQVAKHRPAAGLRLTKVGHLRERVAETVGLLQLLEHRMGLAGPLLLLLLLLHLFEID